MTRRPSDTLIEAVLEDALLSLDELCRVAAVSPEWVRQRLDAGLLEGPGAPLQAERFDAVLLRRVRHMRQLEHGFDAAPELAALVADLHDEIERLRARLRCAGLD